MPVNLFVPRWAQCLLHFARQWLLLTWNKIMYRHHQKTGNPHLGKIGMHPIMRLLHGKIQLLLMRSVKVYICCIIAGRKTFRDMNIEVDIP